MPYCLQHARHNNNNNNNSIQFFIINVPTQQLQRQLQTQHNVDIGTKIKSKPHNNNNSINNINSIQSQLQS
jgi:hypothetical protein